MTAPTTNPDDRLLETARVLVLNMLRHVDAPTTMEIRENVGLVLDMLRAKGDNPGVSEDELVRDIEMRCNIWVGRPTTLEELKGHVEWLSGRRAEIEWRFWDRYRRYLEEVEHWAPRPVRTLDEATDLVLRQMEDPMRAGAWDRRGMVVGQVQSGKTANYTGLICKAADAGYRLIIILAGVHNSLRSQTQLRLDQGFLGFDTQQRRFFDQNNARIGVGALTGVKLHHVNSLTNSEERGDFTLSVAKQANVMVGGRDPLLLVVKKNPSVLRNLIKWATLIQQQLHPESGRMIVPDVPILVIDDEADHASVNTRDIQYDENGNADDETNPTAINGLIRQLLHSFEQSAYVGYTATPFANIFIYKDAMSERHGEDLFPRSFIVNLPTPSNYIGPAQVFGVAEDTADGVDEQPGLPIVRTIDDYEDWIPNRHKKDHVPGPLPQSLKTAMRCFILSCATRMARGQVDVHNSMLVHVTRFTDVQAHVAELVADELGELKDRLRYGDGSSSDQLVDELAALWETDYLTTTRAFDKSDLGSDLRRVDFNDIRPHLHPAASRIEIMKINGTAKDALTYYEHPKGLSVIAIGGDKLSRGLTLEGLSVSYYLRASKMYDTLMQMGRWFGYRPGYADLCRLFTTSELNDWYRDITAANEELGRLFNYMQAVGGTPEEFGLRVRNHPDGLLITARAKMRHGIKVYLSFSDTIIETIVFDRQPDVVHRNAEDVESFLRQLDRGGSHRTDSRDNFVWEGVAWDEVVTFLDGFDTHPDARKAQGKLLAKYIRGRAADDELTDWTVALISNPGAQPGSLAGLSVGLTTRAQHTNVPLSDRYVIRRLVSPLDEQIDLDDDEKQMALTDTRDAWKIDRGRSRRTEPPDIASGPAIRNVRSPRNGLLLLYPLNPTEAQLEAADPIMGFAVSFPKSEHVSTIEYTVTNTYWDQEMSAE